MRTIVVRATAASPAALVPRTATALVPTASRKTGKIQFVPAEIHPCSPVRPFVQPSCPVVFVPATPATTTFDVAKSTSRLAAAGFVMATVG